MLRTNLKRLLFVIGVCLLTISCQRQEGPKEQDLLRIQTAGERQAAPKKIIFFMVDSLMAQAIDRGIRQNELPTFRYLIKHGQYFKDMVSSFPTMSVTIDSTLLTGAYPDEHRLPGLTWYPQGGEKAIGYGSGPLEVLLRGTRPVLINTLIEMNGRHLNPSLPTIYEDLQRRGVTTGSVNGLIYRGLSEHRLTLPAPVSGLTSLPKEITVKGPDFLTFGALSNPLAGQLSLPDGPANLMGFNDRYAVETVKYLIRTKQLPDFLLVYLPELDRKVHKHGPADLSGIRDTDRELRSMLEAFGSIEQALKEAVVIVAGDNGMSQVVPKEQDPAIDLPKLLSRFEVLPTGGTVSGSTEVVLGVNDMMAYVYSLKPGATLKGIADVIRSDKRIDAVAWEENGRTVVYQGGSAKTLEFRQGGELTDPYGQTWTVKGDEDILDLKRVDSGSGKSRLTYGKYPDALRRLRGALNSHQGRFLVVTAKPGYELTEAGSPTHPGGGAHGGFDQATSLVPLIICGTDKRPEHLRIIDLKPFLLELSGQGGRGRQR
ncbi:alkaline phosphatase family protein [Paenibacillus oralis]|uniref:Alkaline phosphatase family protein n=1 Tax=Paenibacillus oralis TaxID=2490856 RepID=A0A3P3U6A9_9BACL|nr:alkaline phosphatase family protein [Paenibacillus oralis]RRJ65901.1 alkaline phosphatase family protein [Paenibacillus oralis]